MSLKGFLLRFTLIYVALLVAVGIVFSLLNFKSGSAGGTAALLGAVMWACSWFARANKRYFTASEKHSAVWGMLLIDTGLQTLVAAALLPGPLEGASMRALLLGVAFVAVLHAIVIWFFVGLAGKQYAKEMAARKG